MAKRISPLILAFGVVAVMLIALPWKAFELDRYFVSKELVLNGVALAVATGLLMRRRRVAYDATDTLLALFIVWSAISSLFATNHWLAQRALSVSVASALIFWSARELAAAGAQRLLLGAASLATVVAAASALAQAYGVESEYFTLARSPGGTLGNRNFVAHVVAIGLPVTFWLTVTAKRSAAALLGSIAIAILTATLVLSRSRAAWLAVAACVIVVAVPLFISRRYWDRQLVGGRLARLLLAAVIAGILAVVLPNSLNWKSDSPYLDSARNMVDYSSGSGRGRVAQYRNSLKMARADPLLGVAPGNWPVKYVRFAPGGDPSLLVNGMTANPWPSSDWVAFVAERGAIAALALLGLFAATFLRALRRWRDQPDGDAVLMKVALAGTVVTTMVVSAFDAVLLLPAPAFLVWLILGAATAAGGRSRMFDPSPKAWRSGAAVLFLFSVVSIARSSAQVKAMYAVGKGGQTAGWVAGARWDPGSYRINQRVAELYVIRRQCARARQYAERSAGLFPHAAGPKRVLRRCPRRG